MATKFQCDFCKEVFDTVQHVKGGWNYHSNYDASAVKVDDTVRVDVIVVHPDNGGIDCCEKCTLHLMSNAIKLNKPK